MTNARWHQNSSTSWVLKAPVKDGGAVLALVEWNEQHRCWQWIVGTAIGNENMRYQAQYAVRKALREQQRTV